MKCEARRKELSAILMSCIEPVSGSELSKRLKVSRQIIVHDIAVLKAAGYDILSTHSGYIMNASPLCEKVFKVRHSCSDTYDELSLIVSLGGIVVDVYVWHKLYGKISANLNIFSELGIQKFMEGIKSGKSTELMNITDGYHYHTIRAESDECMKKIESALISKNYIVPEVYEKTGE